MIEEGLFTYLSAQATLTALIDKRVYPQRMPDQMTALFPALTYQRISGRRELAHTGDSHLVHARFQFSAWGRQYEDARGVGDALIGVLKGYRGAMGVHDVSVVEISDQDEYEEETKLHRVIVDAVLWYND